VWDPDSSSGDGPGLVGPSWPVRVWTRGYRLPPMHRVSAVPAEKGVPRRLAVGEAAATSLSDGPVTDGHSAEHSDDHVGGTCVVDEVVDRWGHRMGLSDL
jgi:hypothetical protein